MGLSAVLLPLITRLRFCDLGPLTRSSLLRKKNAKLNRDDKLINVIVVKSPGPNKIRVLLLVDPYSNKHLKSKVEELENQRYQPSSICDGMRDISERTE